MFALGNRQTTRRKHHKSSEGRRRDQGARAAAKKQLRIEPLESRQLLSVFAVTNLGDGPVANPGDLPGSLRQAIYDANANPGADTIGFDSSLSGGTIALTNGELAIKDSVTIQGLGAANMTIDAGGQSRIFNVNDGNNSTNINVEIDGLTLTGGYVSGTTWPGNAGGAIFSYESLTVRNSTITGNTVTGQGGGIATGTGFSGTTIIQDSTVSGNTAGNNGGGIYARTFGDGMTTIQNSTISGNTVGGSGGGIFLATSFGDTTIQNCDISGNAAYGGSAGGVWARTGTSGTTMIRNSTISGNTASSDAGGIVASTSYGAMTIQNSTIFGNTANGRGGGISAFTYSGSTTVQNSTITGNVSDFDSNGFGAGGGICSASGMISVQSTIIAANTDNSGAAPDVSGQVHFINSLVGDNTGSGLAEVAVGTTDPSGNGNIVGDPNGQGTIDPGLGTLANNGGPPQTCALLAGSPAIDTGANPAGLATDQRGEPFAREFGAAPDMGAYEVNSLSLVVNTLADENSGVYDPSHLSLREAVALANINPGPDTISFDPSLDGGTINLTIDELAITDSVTIQGPGAANLTIDAVNHSRIFNVNDYDYNTNIDVEIDGLTLTGGNASGSFWPSDAGGAILSFETLTVSDCIIEGNTAADYGGGILAYAFAGGTTTIQSSTISGNTAGSNGGGIWAQSYGATVIENSVISGNTASGDSGGGVYARVGYGGTLTIQGNTISGNTAEKRGGGIGAWTYDGGATTIQDNTISGNTSNDAGGGIWTETDGASTTTIQGSTISGNTAAGAGGGIWAFTYAGNTTIQNSTISGNTAGGRAGGIYSNNYGTATLQNSTVTGNTSNGAGGGVYSHNHYYYGSYNSTYPLTIRSTIIAGNTDKSATAPDAAGQLDISTSLVGDNTGSGLDEVPVDTTDPSGLGNIVGDPNGQGVIDPKLGPLADNGGPTQTFALLTGSPAIDAGANPTGLPYDQRGVGFPRELGKQADMGAFESPDTTTPVATLDPNSVVVTGSVATFTVTYTDADDNVLRSSIDGNNILVTKPGAFTQLASLVSVAPDGDGSSLVATYSVDAQGGAWTMLNTGTFTATMEDGQVSDTNNNFVAGGSLGTFIVDTWVPYTPATSVNILTMQADTSVTVSFALSSLDIQRVADWGQVTWQGSTCTVDMTVQQWTGHASGGTVHILSGPIGSPQFMQIENHVYDLGSPAAGNYTFILTNGGQPVSTESFLVKPAMTIDRVVVAEATPQNGILESNEQLVITWAVNNADQWMNNSLTVDGKAATAIYGPYGPNADGSYYVAGVFGPVGAGPHQFAIHSAENIYYTTWDQRITSADYSGQFDVAAPKISIAQVVVAEATPKNGILESNEQLVITWAVNGADTVASKSLLVDGKAVTLLYGPYGPNGDGSYYIAGVFGPVGVGTHQFTIHSADSKGNAADYSGQFDVAAPKVSIAQVMVAEATAPKNGILESTDQLLITWAVKGADKVGSRSLSVDGKAVSLIYGPYGPQADGSYYFGGQFGPVGAGTHTYVIQSTDSKGNAASSSGTFNVLPADVKISDVVVAEAQAPTNGVIGTSEPIVISWAITGPASATTVAAHTGLTVDGKSISTKYGPYGPVNTYTYDWSSVFGPLSAGTHNYVIQANDGNGHSAKFTGSFKVSTAAHLTVDAALPPQGSAASVSDQQLASIVNEAERRWTLADGTQVLAAMAGVKVEVADLAAGTLGETVGKTILIDRDAAGYGWFVDPTPRDDSEFAGPSGSQTLAAGKGTAATQRVDLLTAVMHEMGHELGLGHIGANDLMSAVLPLGARRTISAIDLIGIGSSEHDSVDQLFAAIGN